jgi:hypothetical protein
VGEGRSEETCERNEKKRTKNKCEGRSGGTEKGEEEEVKWEEIEKEGKMTSVEERKMRMKEGI